MWVSEATRRHYRAVAREETLMVGAARKAWRQVDKDALVPSWKRIVDSQLFPVIADRQREIALISSSYSAEVLADQDFWVAPSGWVDPNGLAGVNVEGGALSRQLLAPAYRAEALVAGGMATQKALQTSLNVFTQMLVSVAASTSQAAAGMDVAVRDTVGFVRVVHPSACSRCVILAGKFYRWNEGFLRHPQCRCEHQATTDSRKEGMLDDPYKVFESMSEAEQDRRWGKAGAQAVRDGADIYQVTNARRGMVKSRMFTTEGTTRRGYAAHGLKRGQRRMTPDAIYQLSGGNRGKALEMLKEHGYVLPGGQVPGGSLRGRVSGHGQMGKGGKAAAARDAVEAARATGVRDPGSRYTMTAAERRMHDAETRYRMVLEGRNPFTAPGFGQTPDPHGMGLNTKGGGLEQPLTPQIAAMVEKDYRYWLARGGEKFI